MKKTIALTAVLLSACATSEEVWGGRTAVVETQAVQAVTVRWLAQNYEPSQFLGDPKAVCLVVADAVGRRDFTATAQAARSTDMDPTPLMLSRLRDVRPPVVPISECRHGDDLAEVLVDTGERAIVLGVGYPTWVTPDLARIGATIRENPRNWFRYRCSLTRGPDGWELRRCT